MITLWPMTPTRSGCRIVGHDLTGTGREPARYWTTRLFAVKVIHNDQRSAS
jgi:hypothetical protein